MRSLAAFISRVAGLVRGAASDHDRALGARGEREAERFLRAAGYAVRGRNLRLPMGEIDLLCTAPDGRTVVLVEVKARERVQGAGGAGSRVTPEAAVTARKQRKLVALARHLRRANGWEHRPFRIDVVAVEFDAGGGASVRHFLGAVRS